MKRSMPPLLSRRQVQKSVTCDHDSLMSISPHPCDCKRFGQKLLLSDRQNPLFSATTRDLSPKADED
jgi:hypothetical protein